MRDTKRIDRMIDLLREAWREYPDFRLGQLVTVIGKRDDVFYVEDDKMEEQLIEFLNRGPRIS
jgi:uncharacterized protein YihD (DUF1040 family)